MLGHEVGHAATCGLFIGQPYQAWLNWSKLHHESETRFGMKVGKEIFDSLLGTLLGLFLN